MKAARKGLRVITGKCGCFTAATLVMTAQGAVPIGEIEEGQQVLAAPDDGLSESYSSNTVGTKIVVGEANLVQLLVLHEDGSSEIISTTDEHPFHVADTAEWTRADGLVIGDQLSTISGSSELVGVLFTTERVPVYNLSIPGTPTYYVGEHGVWVHNAAPCFRWKNGREYESYVRDTLGSKHSFDVAGKEFDGRLGNMWYEVKMFAANSEYWTQAKVVRQIETQARIAKENGRAFAVVTPDEISSSVRTWFNRIGATHIIQK